MGKIPGFSAVRAALAEQIGAAIVITERIWMARFAAVFSSIFHALSDGVCHQTPSSMYWDRQLQFISIHDRYVRFDAYVYLYTAFDYFFIHYFISFPLL